MSSVRDAWTDERLDDLNRRVETGFHEMQDEMREFRSEMQVFRSEVNTRFETMEGRIDGIQRSMFQQTVAMTAAILTGFGGMAALLATSV